MPLSSCILATGQAQRVLLGDQAMDAGLDLRVLGEENWRCRTQRGGMIRDHKLQRAELFKLKSKSSSAIAKNVERDSYSCVYMRISPIFLAHRPFSPSSSLFR